jgi:hypothetical protein
VALRVLLRVVQVAGVWRAARQALLLMWGVEAGPAGASPARRVLCVLLLLRRRRRRQRPVLHLVHQQE